MNLLLDTHTTIWFITEDKTLPAHLKELIEDGANTCFVSIASLWEMATAARASSTHWGNWI